MPDRIARMVEARIAEAKARGELEPEPGKPLVLDDLEGLTEGERFAALFYRSAGETRPEVVLLGEIRALREERAKATDAATRERLQRALADKATELAALFDRARAARRSEKTSER